VIEGVPVRVAALCLFLVLVLPASALAVDGVIEINQARANAGSVTPGDTPGFPVEIFTPGSYRLTGNLSVPAGSDAGIAIYAAGTRLDLAGFSITSTTVCSGAPLACAPTGTGAGINASGASDVAVSNGRVAGFGVWGVALFEGGRVERIAVESNGFVGILGDRNAVLVENVVRRNGGPGIQVGAGSRLVGNVASGNAGFGAEVGAASALAQNVFEGNAAGSVSGGRAIAGNVCDDGRCSARATRRFYLTAQAVNGSQALSACVAGFHMAAFWELQHLSVLEYAPHLGKSGFDTGKGAPNDPGWARTGTANNSAGPLSCNLWTSTSGLGQRVALEEPSSAAGSGTNISPWLEGSASCNANLPVWCVED
jgi:hypothetical protein